MDALGTQSKKSFGPPKHALKLIGCNLDPTAPTLASRKPSNHGGGTGGPGPHHVRPTKRAKKGYLRYGQGVIDNSMINGANRQITLCFLQDLLSEVSYHEVQRINGRVKLKQRCEPSPRTRAGGVSPRRSCAQLRSHHTPPRGHMASRIGHP